MKRVLMIAFQFPPFAGSSAVQRTLRFVRYLPEWGWEPLVLTAHPRAYEVASPDQLSDVPPGTVVERAFSLDAAKHFGILRRYPAWAARPDRWTTWWLGAVIAGRRLIRRYRPAVLWSTFPIPTAHVIGRTLHRFSGLPWVADFRDPMVQPDDPSDPRLWAAYAAVERTTILCSQLNVFTTPGTRALYAARYPDVPGDRLAVVENGYDEAVFASVEAASAPPQREGRMLLLHSGAIYPLERDPSQFLRALAALRRDGLLSPDVLSVRLRATAHDEQMSKLIATHRVGDLVELAPAVPYREAISEMFTANGLLIFQAGQVKTQVPAKIYEYLRTGRPILALTDPDGDTAAVLRNAGVRHIARIDAQDEITRVMMDFIKGIRDGSIAKPDPDIVRAASRRNRTGQLAGLLDRVIARGPA